MSEAAETADKAVEAWKKSIAIDSDPDERARVKKKLDLYTGGA